jgi:hypothetical protein
MVQFNNSSSVMESGDHSKNGTSPKSLTSRGKMQVILILFCFAGIISCENKKNYDISHKTFRGITVGNRNYYVKVYSAGIGHFIITDNDGNIRKKYDLSWIGDDLKKNNCANFHVWYYDENSNSYANDLWEFCIISDDEIRLNDHFSGTYQNQELLPENKHI